MVGLMWHVLPFGSIVFYTFYSDTRVLRIDRDLSAAIAAVVLISDCDSLLRIDGDLSAASRLWYSFLTATA